MLSFRAITKNDIPIIRKYTTGCNIQSCDFTLCGIYLWGGYYRYELCEHEHTLFIKGVDEKGKPAFAFPIGSSDPSVAVKTVREYCEAQGLIPRFSFIPQDMLSAFEGGVAAKLDGWSDYIYDADSLKTLSGKKLHKKKNRFNKFRKVYENHTFLRINHDNLSLLREFYSNFLAENPPDNERLIAESEIIKRVFDEFDLLDLSCGLLVVDDTPVAFAIGEKVGDTLYIHFEKALRSYDGAFEAINCLFVREFADGALFVDREEDMNDLGLRQAKTAYCPTKMVDKYEISY